MTLRDYLSVLRRRLWTVALICLLVAGAALAASSLQTPVYEATTRVLLGANQTTVDSGNFGQYIDASRVQTEIQVLLGKPVADLVHAELGTVPGIKASAVAGTAVIELTARSSDPAVAADVANTYAKSYIAFRQKQFVEAVTTQTREYARQIAVLSAQITAVEARPRSPGEPPPQEVDSLRAEQALFRVKLQQLDSAERLSGAVAGVINPATPAATPISPTTTRNVLLGIFVGLVLGIGVALLFEHLDDSINTKDDVERTAPELTVLGIIPLIAGWRERSEARVIAATDPTSAAAEAYRALRTSIHFKSLDRSLRVVQVTSPIASEGKTTTLANLAITFSQAGLQVIAVCCDLRRPRLHEFFDLPNDIGFTSVLLGQVPLTSALQSVPGTARLRVLASGPILSNPSELLSSSRTTDLLAELAGEADIVLVDCPPVLPVTDAAVLATKVDGTLVVASAGSTTHKELTRVLEVLGQVDASVLGVVLNGGATETSYAYRYQYGQAPSGKGPAGKEVKADRAADKAASRTASNDSRRRAS